MSNTFAAFNRGFVRGTQANSSVATDSVAPAASTAETPLLPTSAILHLADSPSFTAPFAEFSRYLPGDQLQSMDSALQLMKSGVLEFVGDIGEKSDVRLTGSGQELAATLRKSFGPR